MIAEHHNLTMLKIQQGNDESITTMDSIGEVGKYTPLALDAIGRPTTNCFDGNKHDLKEVKCSTLGRRYIEGQNYAGVAFLRLLLLW